MVPARALALGFAVSALAAGCTESSKVSERKAIAHVERLAKLSEDDVDEVRRGLPRGAKALGQIWEGKGDPHADPGSVRRALEKVRNEDRDLEIAKSTFFALADDKGTVFRSDQEPDQLAGKSLVASYPALVKVLAGEPIEVRGSMPETAARARETTSNGLRRRRCAIARARCAECT